MNLFKIDRKTDYGYDKKIINLLPKEYLRKKGNYVKKTALIAAAVLFVSVLGFVTYYLTSEYARIDNENASIEARVAVLKSIEDDQKLISDLNKRIDFKANLLEGIDEKNKSTVLVLKTIESNLPFDVYFESLDMDSENSITLSCLAGSELSIAELVHNLKKQKIFNLVEVSSIVNNAGLKAYSLEGEDTFSYDSAGASSGAINREEMLSFILTCEYGGIKDETASE